jgi:hypothetical protein
VFVLQHIMIWRRLSRKHALQSIALAPWRKFVVCSMTCKCNLFRMIRKFGIECFVLYSWKFIEAVLHTADLVGWIEKEGESFLLNYLFIIVHQLYERKKSESCTVFTQRRKKTRIPRLTICFAATSILEHNRTAPLVWLSPSNTISS